MNISSVKLNIEGSPIVRVYSQLPKNEVEITRRGQVFLIISHKESVVEANQFDAGRVVKVFFDEYFSNFEKTAFDQLKSSTKNLFNGFLAIKQPVEILSAAFVGEVLYSSSVGGAKLKIFRDNVLATILDSKTAKSDELISASGFPKIGDIAVLGNERFFSILPEWKLGDSLRGQDTNDSLAKFKSEIKDEDAGGVFIIFGEKGAFQEEITQTPLVINAPKINPVEIFSRLVPKINFGLFRRPIKVNDPTSEGGVYESRNKTTQTVGIIILVLLVLSIFFGIRQKSVNDDETKFSKIVETTTASLIKSQEIKDVSPEESRALFLASKKEIEDLIKSGIKNSEILELKKKIDEIEGGILGDYKAAVSTFLDLSLLSSGFTGEKFITSDKFGYILDSSSKKLIRIDLGTKKSEVVAGPDQLQGISNIAAYEDNVYGLFPEGIFKLGAAKKEVIKPDWSDVLISAYSSNIYVLEKSTSLIFRYPGIESGFGSKQKWLAPGISVDFSKAVDWVVDGTVWILTSNGDVSKYLQGAPQPFSLGKSNDKMLSPKAIYSDANSKYLYILDPGSAKVFVYSKDGGFKATYSADSLKDAKGISVLESQSKIIALIQNKLFSIDLKHL